MTTKHTRNLLLTLGHNSSAILVEDDRVLCGYEEERLSKVKSDSGFPRLAIRECLNQCFAPTLDTIYISYWNDDFTIFEDTNTYQDKHYDKKFLSTLCKQYNCKIVYLSPEFTHHDAHAYAALNFFENHASETDLEDDFHVIVADGFGNCEEVTTIYKRDSDKLKRVDKLYNYFNSMGLMYQYATSFCGMKENEDEYKFLGYESHIKEILTETQICKLYEYSNSFIKNLFNHAQNEMFGISTREYIDVNKLGRVKESWTNVYTQFLTEMGFDRKTSNIEHIRCIIAAFIQNNIEQFLLFYIKKHNIKNVILSGGIFYNVKLNNFIMNNIEGKICVYPLAGDQGAALGMQRYYEGKFIFNNLLIGKRNLTLSENTEKYLKQNNIERFEHYNDFNQFITRVVQLLREDKIVNMITGNLEIGPRALCSTTTLAQPTDHNFKYINKLNGRNAVMPFAPVILESKAEKYFGKEQIEKIIGSNNYMIITMDHLIPERVPEYTGVLHKYPLKDVYSSRCQFIPDYSERYIRYVLERVSDINDFWIQTSHNEHGRPILLTVEDGLQNHIGTLKNDDEQRSYTLIGNF